MIIKGSTRGDAGQAVSYISKDENKVGLVHHHNLNEDLDIAHQMDDVSKTKDTRRELYHAVISYHKKDNPTDQERVQHALEYLEKAGLSEHQALIATHNDKDHKHTHVLVNRVHPINGKVNNMSFSGLTNRSIAVEMEKQNGYVRTKGLRNNPTLKDLKQAERLGTSKDFASYVRETSLKDIQMASSWKELESNLKKRGLYIKKVNNGIHITDGIQSTKASQVSRSDSHTKLAERYGQSYTAYLQDEEKKRVKVTNSNPILKKNSSNSTKNAPKASARASLTNFQSTLIKTQSSIDLASGKRGITVQDAEAKLENAAVRLTQKITALMDRATSKQDKRIIKALQTASRLTAKEYQLKQQMDIAKTNVKRFKVSGDTTSRKRYENILKSLKGQRERVGVRASLNLKSFVRNHAKLSQPTKRVLNLATNKFSGLQQGQGVGRLATKIVLKGLTRAGLNSAKAAMTATLVGSGVTMAVSTLTVTARLAKSFQSKVQSATNGVSAITRADAAISKNKEKDRSR